VTDHTQVRDLALPHVGAVYERGLGMEWRVLSAGPATVDYEVLSSGERHSLSLKHWNRQPLRLVRRDLKPQNDLAAHGTSANAPQEQGAIAESTSGTTGSRRAGTPRGALAEDAPPAPSFERVKHWPASSATVFDTLRSRCAPEGGLVDALPRRDWLALSGLERGAWLRGVKPLVSMGLVEAWPERCGRVDELRFRLTARGLFESRARSSEPVATGPRAGGEPVTEPVRAGGRAALDGSSSSPDSNGEEKKEPTNQPGSCNPSEPVGATSEPVERAGGLEALVAALPPSLLEAVEGYLRAQTALLLKQVEPPKLDPCERCGAPQRLATNKKTGEKFPACTRYPACKPGSQRRAQSPEEREALERARNAPPVSRETLAVLQRTSDAKKPPTTKTSPRSGATTMEHPRTA
jgi:hypothetical protein